MDNTDKQPTLYSPLMTVMITIVVFFLAQFIGAILISFVAVGLGWEETNTNAWLDTSVWAQFLFVLFVGLATLGLLWQSLQFRQLSWANIGFNQPKLKHAYQAIIGFFVYFAIYLFGLLALANFIPGLNLDQEQQLGFDKTASGISLLPVFLSLVILPPLVEEIVVRGFLYTGLRVKLPRLVAAGITSILFAAAHLGGAEHGLLWVAAIDTFILSMVMCHLRESSGSLWPSIGLHFIKNFIAFFVLFNISQYLH